MIEKHSPESLAKALAEEPKMTIQDVINGKRMLSTQAWGDLRSLVVLYYLH